MNYKDAHILDVLKKRDGLETKIELKTGNILSIWNIAWGYDLDEEFAHITTNISPMIDNVNIDFFITSDIERIFDHNNKEISLDK